MGPLKSLVSGFDLINPPTIELLTNLEKQSLVDGSVDVCAILDFCESVRTVSVRNLPKLHAKVYVADNHLAIITSGNLTRSSLHRNCEYGIQIDDKELIRDVLADVEEFWSRGKAVPISQLHWLANWQENYRQTTRSSQNTGQPNNEQLDDLENVLRSLQPELDTYEDRFHLTREVLSRLRGNRSESDNAVFSRTIVHILGYGPLPSKEIDRAIMTIHPDRCDNTILNDKGTQPRWKHRAAAARKWASKDIRKIEYDRKQKLWRSSS